MMQLAMKKDKVNQLQMVVILMLKVLDSFFVRMSVLLQRWLRKQLQYTA